MNTTGKKVKSVTMRVRLDTYKKIRQLAKKEKKTITELMEDIVPVLDELLTK